MKYSFDSRVRYSEIGEDRHLTLNGMINYFQDCSTFQSEAAGVGMDFLGAKSRPGYFLPGRLWLNVILYCAKI